MKRIVFSISMVGLSIGLMSSDTKYSTVKNTAFQQGEMLKYRISYGFIDAGEAILEVKQTAKKGANRPLYHVKGTGRTLGAFNAFYKVYDVYESYIDQSSIIPWYFVRDVNEGGYKKNQYYVFQQDQNKVDTGEELMTIPHGVQDMISSFYKARTLDFKGMKKNQIFSFKCFMDNEIYTLKIKYKGDEEIKIRKGKFKAHRFVPVVQKGRYFKHEEDVQFWVSADANKIPLLVRAKIPVGTVRLHLVEWKGLKNEFSSQIN